jgi:hypothetical protein
MNDLVEVVETDSILAKPELIVDNKQAGVARIKEECVSIIHWFPFTSLANWFGLK